MSAWRWCHSLDAHLIEVALGDDGVARLSLDGVARKVRALSAGRGYLWTNVELPFEDHHFVEVRFAPAPGGAAARALTVAVDIRGEPVLRTTIDPAER